MTVKISTRLLLAAALASGAIAAAPASAQVAPGFNANSLGATDDGSSSLVVLPFQINFYGVTYSSLYVNNNGNLTFTSASNNFTPTGLGANYTGTQAIIAPFFADVDTRGTGSGTAAYGTGTYNGRQAFGATWSGVGYYQQQTNKLDNFQALLVDRSDVGLDDFDIVFKYGSMQWETGSASGGSNGLGGTSAAVGFNAGTGNAAGTYYQAAGSLTPGSFINGGTNALNGQTLTFAVRAGAPVVVPSAVPEPATWAMMILGMGAVGYAMRRRVRASEVRFDAKIKRMTTGATA